MSRIRRTWVLKVQHWTFFHRMLLLKKLKNGHNVSYKAHIKMAVALVTWSGWGRPCGWASVATPGCVRGGCCCHRARLPRRRHWPLSWLEHMAGKQFSRQTGLSWGHMARRSSMPFPYHSVQAKMKDHLEAVQERKQASRDQTHSGLNKEKAGRKYEATMWIWEFLHYSQGQ